MIKELPIFVKTTLPYGRFVVRALLRPQVISPRLLSPLFRERGVLYLKRACFGLWLKQRGYYN